ncbi:MAG: RsmE family RNA methyltransferase [Kiritimatiellia bacterium]
MNLILIEPSELVDDRCVLTGHRAEHLRVFLHAAPGTVFQVGILEGAIGQGTVLAVTAEAVTFSVRCEETPLAPWFDLVLALPRPRSLKRILFQTAAMGVRNIFLIGAQKVEKSYFSMHLLRPEEYRPVLIDGLMQGKTTRVPQVSIVPRFGELWERLPADVGLRLIANPASERVSFSSQKGPVLIAVGPDGGWTESENAAFLAHGFYPLTLGARPLRTDTAVIALAAVIQDRLACADAELL